MAGKFLQIWSLRSVAKTLAVLVIIALSVMLFATREIPDSFDANNKEWHFWRNLDLAVSLVSLAFASVLLYGSITEFRAFLLAWMIWNVVLVAFWSVFLARKYDELAHWERTFRLVAVVVLVLAEIPVFNYFRYLRVKVKDPESNFAWIASPSKKVYKTLSEQPSIASINSVFADTSSGTENQGFRKDSTLSTSEVSIASEEMEEHNKKEEQKVEYEEGSVEKQEESDAQSQASFEISVTVHTNKATENNGRESQANEATDAQNSEEVESKDSTSEKPTTDQETSSSTESQEKTSEVEKNQTPVSMQDTTEEEEISSANSSSVVVEIENVENSSHNDISVSVEIDVTDTTPDNHTSF